MSKKQKKMLIRIVVTIILLIVNGLFFDENIFLFLVGYGVIGYDIVKKAFHGILNKQLLDENFLMVVATIGSICMQDYEEAVSVMLFYQIGELFQSYAVGKSRKSISELMDIRPDYANILEDDKLVKVDPYDVNIGQQIVIKPGEKIPLDGIVVEGESYINIVALTGESNLVAVQKNSEVFSGSINVDGVLTIEVTKEFTESTASKILDLVENATSLKSKSENFISKFAKYYTPIVCICALVVALLMPIIEFIFYHNWDFSTWVYRGLTFLVISCPCALVISIPLSFFGGIGGASKSGILVKGSSYLETLSKIDTIVFDKTGTITKGVFEVDDVHHNKLNQDKLLEYAAHCELYSSHPIALSIKRAYGKEIVHQRVSESKEVVGQGLISIVDGKEVIVGNEKMMENYGIKYIKCHSYGTIIHVAIDSVYQGHIVIRDILKPNAKKCIQDLHTSNIHTAMLTGDQKEIALDIAAQLDIKDVYYELLPQNKIEKVEKLLAQNKHVCFVGDGINDAPVLSRSDVGIAMGVLGSDAAIEAADIILMDDNLLKINKAIRIAKKTLKIVYENIYFAIIVKIICLILSLFGITNMWLAIFADTGVMIIAVINAIRALFVKGL